jgi:hypothetical protein
MRIFFDTEFIEDGHTIDLISIGMVTEDGVELYGESSECDLSRANDWVKANVLPHLRGGPTRILRSSIAAGIVAFVKAACNGEKPEFWGYYADYDWVALCQLYGPMINLPKGWPMYCRDIKQLCDTLGDPKLEKPEKEHDALEDARWNKVQWEKLTQMVMNGVVPRKIR